MCQNYLYKFILFSLFLGLLSTAYGNASITKASDSVKRGSLTYGIWPDAKPLNYQIHGRSTGVMADFLTEAVRRIGFDLKIKERPPSRIPAELVSGHIDIAIYVQIQGVEVAVLSPSIARSTSPILSYKLDIIALTDSPIQIQDRSELNHYRIGYIRYMLIDRLLINYANFGEGAQKYNNHPQIMKSLKSGRIDLALSPAPGTASVAEALDMTGQYRTVLPFSGVELYLMASRTSLKEQTGTILKQLDQTICEMKKEGILQKMISKHSDLKYFFKDTVVFDKAFDCRPVTYK